VTHAGGCVNLDSRLQQLASADDPAAFAQTSGLEYDGARVRVVIELSGDAGPDPAVYGLDIEGQYANLLQARVPVDQLCAVAGDPTVSGVRPPSFGVPVTG
jgi:hypothetical protein